MREYLFQSAKWIGTGDRPGNEPKTAPSPFFRKEFVLKKKPSKGEVFFCGLGYSELYLNGKKVDDGVLQPVVSQYDRRAGYLRYDISPMLKKGKNVFGAVLGDGWYNSGVSDTWHFEYAPWRDFPKMILEFYCDGELTLVSDDSWKCLRKNGPIRFNALRAGETYDARLEQPGWAEPGFDDSSWNDAAVVPGPGGILTEQTMPACKVMKRLPPVRTVRGCPDGTVYDFGQIITGWVSLRVRGGSGSKVRILYSERVANDFANMIDRKDIEPYVNGERFQTDEYILKGVGEESWEPRFTYHGFRYVKAEIEGNAEILRIEGCLVHTSFGTLVEFESSDPVLNKLHENACWSYVDNFTGIPTDCPHREKNGWTGDAQVASEMGLFHYDTASSYRNWLQILGDAQRPNGQFPGIAPTCGWGYNWGSGPAWDSAFLVIPWNIYVYTGDLSFVRDHYDQMKRYLDFLGTMSKDGILSFGLGDWLPVDWTRVTDFRLTSTAYYYGDAVIMRKFSELLGKKEEAKEFSALAEKIRKSFRREFYLGNGIYGSRDKEIRKDDVTALACALYWGLCPERERKKTAALLDEAFRKNQYKADFGLLGAKYILRALADNGYGETAYRILMQPSYPGWVDWINHGATTLWEMWNGTASHCHIMHGDIAAWMIQYLGGIVPDENAPGFSALSVCPLVPEELDSLRVRAKTAGGTVTVEWMKKGGRFHLKVTRPKGVPCTVTLPDGTVRSQSSVSAEYECLLPPKSC